MSVARFCQYFFLRISRIFTFQCRYIQADGKDKRKILPLFFTRLLGIKKALLRVKKALLGVSTRVSAF